MRPFSGTIPAFDFDLCCDRAETFVGAIPARRKDPSVKERRARVVLRILSDAGQGAGEYIDRFEAGRGAE